MQQEVRALASCSRWGARVARVAVLLCVTVFGVGQAGDTKASDALELTLEDAVGFALARNRGFLKRREDRAVQQLNLEIAEDRWAPRVSLSSNARRDRDASGGTGGAGMTIMVPATGGRLALNWDESLSDSSGDTRSRSLGFTQPLLKGGPASADHAIRRARLGEQGNILGLRGAAAALISETIGQYRALIRAARQVEIAETALRRAQEQLARTRALIEVGRVARREAVRSEATIANRELALVTARNALDTANLALVDHLAFEEAVRIRPLASLTVERREVDHASVLADALRLRPDYRQAQLNVETARIALEAARNNLLPDLSLQFNMSRTDHRQADMGAGIDRSVMLNATIPLNDRQAEVALVGARLGLRQAERDLTGLRASIDIAVRRAVTDVTVNLRRTDLAREARALAESNLEIEKGKFNEGLASSAEVATAEDNLVQAEEAEVNAINTYLAALTQLDQVSGRTLARWDVELETP
ncbi:MAG: TolC family protein [Alphaproteobacteria bacterium]|nr:TolC family protein [Alphaproteobacteria bacterium]